MAGQLSILPFENRALSRLDLLPGNAQLAAAPQVQQWDSHNSPKALPEDLQMIAGHKTAALQLVHTADSHMGQNPGSHRQNLAEAGECSRPGRGTCAGPCPRFHPPGLLKLPVAAWHLLHLAPPPLPTPLAQCCELVTGVLCEGQPAGFIISSRYTPSPAHTVEHSEAKDRSPQAGWLRTHVTCMFRLRPVRLLSCAGAVYETACGPTSEPPEADGGLSQAQHSTA